MRAVLQRVLKASVTVNEEVVGSIDKGLAVLVGLGRDDTDEDIEYIVRKILNLRFFDSSDGKRWDKSVVDMNYEVLCVSQFTLFAIMKGNKFDFHQAMNADDAPAFYEKFLATIRSKYKPEFIKDGVFRAMMQVHIQNDGPVTINLDSKSR